MSTIGNIVQTITQEEPNPAVHVLSGVGNIVESLIEKHDNPHTSIFNSVASSAEPEKILGNLLKEAHLALTTVPNNEEHVASTLRNLLAQIQPPEPLIEAANALFHSANIETIFEVGDEILAAAKEHALRDNEPERTLSTHVRELLDAGDEPTAILQVLEAWTNPKHEAQRTEEIRLTVSEEWARKLALEQQSPETINASLKLHLPDSNLEGHNHASVSNRIYGQVTGGDPHLNQASQRVDSPTAPAQTPNIAVDAHPELTMQQGPKR